MVVKIWKIADCDWVAAETVGQAIDLYMGESGVPFEEIQEDIVEVDDDDMEKLKFIDDIENAETSPRRSFRKQLTNMINARVKFPTMFATSEY